MILNEIVKSFLKPENVKITPSSVIPQDKALHKDDVDYGSFFDSSNYFDSFQSENYADQQNVKIMQYREVATRPEVAEAVQHIVNEIVFTYINEVPLKIQVDLDNEKLSKQLSASFDKISKLMRLDLKLYQYVTQGYVDGVVIFHLTFNNKKPKDGIQKITMIDPVGLSFNKKENVYSYSSVDYFGQGKQEVIFSPEEIVKVDFGLKDGQINLSYLEKAIKVSNMLSSLEDMLIPLRFSRSISRRVFNVDIGDVAPKRGQAILEQHQQKFKYKKFYNTKTGEISNSQHITSMVEDYWFANRSGGKGTTVELLDESGNLGELGDVEHFTGKLYKALNIPLSRVSVKGGEASLFETASDQISRDETNFFQFISRLRQVYEELFKTILKHEVLSIGAMSIDEWDAYSHNIRVIFSSENVFFDRMKTRLFTEKINAFRDITDFVGKMFSVRTAMKRIFNMNDEEIESELNAISEESLDKLFSSFYSVQE